MVKLTEAGARYLDACRRILAELAEADQLVAREQAAPRGALSVTAPAAFGRLHVRPIVDAFLEAHRDVQVRLLRVPRSRRAPVEGGALSPCETNELASAHLRLELVEGVLGERAFDEPLDRLARVVPEFVAAVRAHADA